MIISIFSTIFFALGKIKETSKANFFQSIISILAQYAGVKFFGLTGLVSAQLISLLLFSAWYFPAKTITLIKFDSVLKQKLKREVLLILIISLMTVLVFIKIDGAESWLRFLINLMLMVITYFIALYSVSMSFRKELKMILKHLRILQ
jgi:O-antigen/teichoic acid export membrane protein